MSANSSNSVRRCKDCRFSMDNGEFYACIRNQVLTNKSPKKKPDYVNGGTIKGLTIWFLNTPCQETREDIKQCGPGAAWFEARQK